LTQAPLAVIEGLVTVAVVNTLTTYSRPELTRLRFLTREA
jgi:ABC-type Co2+ transport system permease subunit